MGPNNLKQFIPVFLFFTGMGVIVYFGMSKSPRKLGIEVADTLEGARRKITSTQVHSTPVSPKSVKPHEDEKEVAKVPEKKAPEHVVTQKSPVHQEEKQEPEHVSAPRKVETHQTGVCQWVEYRGDGDSKTQVSPADWVQVVNLFHRAKDRLSAYLKAHSKEMPAATSEALEKSVRELKIVQPAHASAAEADLSWRGIGVWTRDEQGSPLLLMGSGFLKLMKSDPKRAEFEMTRWVAQSWSPCELARLKLAPLWSPLLSCLGESVDNQCPSEKSVEALWAVSSSLATVISPPSCQLPVFADEKKKACLHEIFGSGWKIGSDHSPHQPVTAHADSHSSVHHAQEMKK